MGKAGTGGLPFLCERGRRSPGTLERQVSGSCPAPSYGDGMRERRQYSGDDRGQSGNQLYCLRRKPGRAWNSPAEHCGEMRGRTGKRADTPDRHLLHPQGVCIRGRGGADLYPFLQSLDGASETRETASDASAAADAVPGIPGSRRGNLVQNR